MPINQADTAWMLVSTALVLLMTPALAFFYGGLVRSKNALNTMMMSFIALGFVGVMWAVIGYSLAFAPGNNWIGDTSRLFLRGVGLEAQGTIPHLLFMCYQGTFLHHHGGADLRRHRRADALLGLRHVHHAVGAGRVLPDRALGVGRRMAGEDGRARLRRRHGRARERGRRGAGGRDRRRQAAGLSELVAAAAQRAVHAARRRAALVRLVRLQRRQRAGRQRHRRARVHDDDAGAGGDAGGLDAARCRAPRQADGGWRAPRRSSSASSPSRRPPASSAR